MPQDVTDAGAAEHGVEVDVVGFDTCRVQRHGQDRQSGRLLEPDDADGWKRIEVDDPKNFASAPAAAARLASLPQWRVARVVKSNPDAPQLPIRAQALAEASSCTWPSPA